MAAQLNFRLLRIACYALIGSASISLARAQDPLPQGDKGIAAKYPGDRDLESADEVVFFESFDAPDVETLAGKYESVERQSSLSLSADTAAGSADAKSLLITHVGGEGTGSHLYRRLEPGYEKLHYRFNVKFDRDCYPIHHFFHVGGYYPATAWAQGGAGTRPRGDERFTTGVEPFGDNWTWDYYSYWKDMRGSPPRGQTWGNTFLHDDRRRAPRGEWMCLELMMKLNDLGKSNGEMALWINGELVSHLGEGFPKGKWVYDKFLPGQGGDGVRWSDAKGGPEYLTVPEEGSPFEGFEFRTREEQNLNFLWLLCYITKAPKGHVSKVWFDNIVIAREYIGPIFVER